MSSETLYHEGTHTSGDDRNDTGSHVPISEALILYTASDGGTYDSDKDTGYGESEDSDNEERHAWETENSSRKVGSQSVTASSSPMEQTDLHSPNTSYRAGMHTLGDNTEGEEDTNLLTIDEDSE